jgi:hypothetical protein
MGRGKSLRSLTLIQAAYDFLAVTHPATVRACCYKLFTLGLIPSMSRKETGRVSKQLTDAREQGLIPWLWIVDETRRLERTPSWDDPAEFVKAVRQSYRRDFWTQQPDRVEVWSEKGTVRGTLGPVLEEYGVGFRVMHGWSSATTVNDIATAQDGRDLIALYVGDFDPSGMGMSEMDLPERLARYGGDHVEVRRIALIAADTAAGDLPPFSVETKRKDPRYRWFLAQYGTQCWEVDAMDPRTLRDRVQVAIQELIEPEAWARCERAQEAEQASLKTVLDAWTAPGPPHETTERDETDELVVPAVRRSVPWQGCPA